VDLLRTLFFIKAHWELEVQAVHIPGHQNGLADAILRNKFDVFLIVKLLISSWARLGVSILVPTARELFEAGLASSTRKSYRAEADRYIMSVGPWGAPLSGDGGDSDSFYQ